MILKVLEKLDAVEIQPYDAEVYNSKATTEKGFQYIGTLSPRLQRLGTLLNLKKQLRNTEREASRIRAREVEESENLTTSQKLGIIANELPSRLETLARLEMVVGLLNEIFNFEMVCEMRFEPKEEVPTALELKIFRDWEVAIKGTGDVRDLRGSFLEKPVNDKDDVPRRGQHRHGNGINFTGGKHGEA